jgi:hypothetical protein
MKALAAAAVLLGGVFGGLWAWCSVEPSKWGDLSYVVSTPLGVGFGVLGGIWVVGILAVAGLASTAQKQGNHLTAALMSAAVLAAAIMTALPLSMAAATCVDCVASWRTPPPPPPHEPRPTPELPTELPPIDTSELLVPRDGETCPASDWQHLVGQKRMMVPRSLAGPNVRIDCETCPRTADSRPERMNIFFDDATQLVLTVACG